MAARTGTPSLAQQEKTRAAIQTSQLVNRLQNFALNGVDPKTKEPIEIDAQRIKAIEILLRKALPDLSNVTLTGDPDNPLEHKVTLDAERFTRSIAGLASRTRT